MEKVKCIIKGIIVFVLFYCSVYFQYIPIKLFNLDEKSLDLKTNVILGLFSSLVIFVIYFIIYRKDLKRDFKKFKENRSDNIDTAIHCWIIGLVLMMVSNIILNFIIKAGGANNEQLVQKMIKSVPLVMFIDAGLIAPFNEEIVFRKTLKDIFKNKWLFIICSFILFGGAHVINSAKVFTDYLYILPYGFLGAAFAYAYYKTDSVWTSVFMHMTHNIVLVLLSILTIFIK